MDDMVLGAARRRWPSFRVKQGLAFALALLADVLFYQRGYAGGVIGVFGAALLVALMLGRAGSWHDRRAWCAAALALLFAGAMVIDPSFLAFMLLAIALSMAALLPQTARFDDGWRWFQRIFLHWALAVFRPVIDGIKLHRLRAKQRGRQGAGRRNWRVLLLPLLGSGVFLLLFSQANPVLAAWFDALALPPLTIKLVARMLLWVLVLLVAWSLLRAAAMRPPFGTFDGRGDVAIPGVSLASITLSLIAFNLIFALQNLMDIAYLWGALPMPQGMTLASYAHRGAYPLIVTALLAALFVLVTLRPGSTTASNAPVRRMVVLWIGQNIFLVGSSILRTLDYVEVYSLTRLRIAALAWMLLVAVGLLLICWRMLRDKSARWLINSNIVAAGLVLGTCSFVDLGEIAARWNVTHARDVGGRGAALDLCYLNTLGSAALVPLIELERRPLTPELRSRVQYVRQRIQTGTAHWLMAGGWSWRDQRRIAQAQPVFDLTRQASARRDCDGRLLAGEPPVNSLPPTPSLAAPDHAASALGKPAPARPRQLTGQAQR